MIWRTSKREITLDRPLVMGIINVTPDSFSDGGQTLDFDDAIRRAEQMIEGGVDIIDIGGESTRPGSSRVDPVEEGRRTVSVSSEISRRFDVPISIDTTNWMVAKLAVEQGGAEIINDISGLRWDARLADVASTTKAGLILMHSRGSFETMHSEPPVDDICSEVTGSLRESIASAKKWGVEDQQIVLDVGIGFGKTPEQNLELIAKLDKLIAEFPDYPMLVGTSRKSFIGRLLGDAPVDKRLNGSLATAAVAVWNGAKIVRVHDVRETREVLNVVAAAKAFS